MKVNMKKSRLSSLTNPQTKEANTMLEKMFTTKMSMDKKKLQNRFSKIRSKNGKTSKFIAMAVFAIIIVSIICVSIWVAVNRQDDTAVNSDIKFTYNGQLLKFNTEPYVLSESMSTGYTSHAMAFFPLEELSRKLGAECEINLNEAVIKIPGASDNYRITLGKNEVYYESLIGTSATRGTKFAPEAKNSILYIPYEFIEYIFIDANNYDIFGSTLYKNETMNVQFEIPMYWLGKYYVDETLEDDGYITINHKRIAEKYDGAGILCRVYKELDKNLEERLTMLANQTVVWQNQEYAYVVGRPTDVQHPIWDGSDKEDIDLASEYENMEKGITHIESTFSLINDVETPNIANAENMSFAQIKDLQRQVDNGHFPWRLDYEQVVQSFLSGKGIDVEGGEITELAGGGSAGGISLTYTVGEKEYTQIYSIELFQPIDKTESGIWIVRTFNDITADAIESVRNKELLLLSEDNIQFKLNADVSTIDKEPISEKEGRGDGFHWKDYSYEDVSVRALIGDDNSTQITHISTTSNNYRTPRDIKVGDSLKQLQQKYPEDLSKALSDEVCYVYVPQSIGVNRIYFYLENDIITKIVVENGIDG